MNLIPIVKKLAVFLCLLFAAVFSVLAQKIIKVDSSHVKTLRVDPSNAVGGVASDFFAEVNYIPLETTKESLFGSISKLEITDDYYIILDQNTHCILIFTKAGKFHTKIKTYDGNVSHSAWSFSVNKWNKQIILSRDDYKTLTYFDYNGKIVKTLKINTELEKDETSIYQFYFLTPDKTITNGYYNDIDSTSKDYKTYSRSLILYANENHKVYAQGLRFKKVEAQLQSDAVSTGLGPITSFGVDTAFFYSKTYDYAIYTITPNAIKFSYKFIFPLYASLPNDFISNQDYNKKRFEWVQKHTGVIWCLSNVFQSGNNLLFRAAVWGSSKEDNLIYNLKSGSLIAYKHIQQDERSYFLPIYDQTGWTFDNTGILACTGGCLYTSVSAVGMFKAYNDNADQKVKYPPTLAEYFKKGSIKDNPAILQLKLKDEL